MKSTVIAILNGNIPWNMILIEPVLSTAIIVISSILEKKNTKFRISPLTLAIGAYLSMSTTSGILLDGILCYFIEKNNKTEKQVPNGVFFASWLIAGEALMKIIIAIPIVLS